MPSKPLRIFSFACRHFRLVRNARNDGIKQQVHALGEFAGGAVIGWRDEVHPPGVEQAHAGELAFG